MTENELGSCNFAFHLENMKIKDEFIDVGMFELKFQIQDLINKPGKYAMTLILCELND